MKLISNQESKYGSFDLVPDEGQELQHFIDYESQLLIVNESPIRPDPLSSQHGRTQRPSKTFIVDPNRQKILLVEEWKKFFTYEPVESLSEDGTLKEIWTRIHEAERMTDIYEGDLIELETGKKLIERAKSIAFRETRRLSLIDDHYQSIEQKKSYERSLQKGHYPSEKYQEYLSSLSENEVAFQFTKENAIHQLIYQGKGFSLHKGEVPLRAEDYASLSLNNEINRYRTIDEFWEQFASSNRWFKEIQASKIHRVMEKFIITAHNQILEQGEISYPDHEKLHSWMNRCFNKTVDRNVYWQFCSNCRKRVMYYSRYPKHACRQCVKLITDEWGNPLDYTNTHEAIYSNGAHQLRLKETKQPVKIFIGEDEYWASEARFGGTVYQKKDQR
ncbi:MAG: hypothetical protein AAF587_38700 [Bacteroidota bacterium]